MHLAHFARRAVTLFFARFARRALRNTLLAVGGAVLARTDGK
jgi:hypothetical protein